MLTSATQVQEKFELRLLSDQHSNLVTNNKWEQWGLNKHLQVSVMAGLFEKFNGASNYFINHRSDPDPSLQVSKTLLCRMKSKEERLDLKALMAKQNVSPLSGEEGREQATHVVVGVLYGAEAFCVLSNDIDCNKESRKDAEENLSLLANK